MLLRNPPDFRAARKNGRESMQKQRSISRSVILEGRNIFWGTKNSAAFHPAEDDSGVIFVVGKNRKIPATLETAFNYRRLSGSCVAVKNDKGMAIKVEHVLAALYVLGIDNVVVELSDGLCPRLDGSISKFITTLSPLLKEGTRSKRLITIRDGLPSGLCTITAPERPDRLTVRRTRGTFLRYESGYGYKAVGVQRFTIPLSEEGAKAVMYARPIFFLPFGSRLFIDWFSWLHGITDENALFIGPPDRGDFANSGSTYDPDEFVKHKVIDAIGVLSLLGGFFIDTEFSYYRTGHAFDLAALRTLASRNVFTTATQDCTGFTGKA